MKKINRKNSLDNYDKFLTFGIDIDDRIVHISDQIDSETTSNCIKGIQVMLKRNKDPIHIYINSMGGDPYSAMGLYSFIRSLAGVPVYTYNTGSVMSAASLIFLAGDKRFMYKYTTFMLHSVASSAEGKVYLDLVDETEECKRIFHEMCEIYAKRTKRTKKQWYSMLKYNDRYIKESEALDINLVHEVLYGF